MKNPLKIEHVKQCRKCANLGQDHVPSSGNPNAEIMIVGQSPGAMEVKYGRPFVGPSGEILDFMFDEAGISRDEVYIANVLKCRPPGNRAAHQIELLNCWNTWLHHEVKQVDPAIVLVLGKDAHDALIQGRTKFKHLDILKSKKRTFLVSWHPAYCLRSGRMAEFIEGTGQALRNLVDSI